MVEHKTGGILFSVVLKSFFVRFHQFHEWWNIGGTFVDRSEPRASIHMFSSIKWSPSHRHVSFGRVDKMYRLASFCTNSHVFFNALCGSSGSHFTTTHRQC